MTEINEEIREIKKEFKSFAKSSYISIVANIKAQIAIIDNYSKNLSLKAYYKQSQLARKACESLIKVDLDLENNILLKQKDILKRLSSVYKKLKKVKFDLELNLDSLDLKYTELKRNKVYYILEASLLFTAHLTSFEKSKLKEQGIKSVLSSYYYGKCKFIVFDVNTGNKEKINFYLTQVNKQIRNSVCPIHDISLQIDNYYICLLIPEIYAKYWHKIINKPYTIYIK